MCCTESPSNFVELLPYYHTSAIGGFLSGDYFSERSLGARYHIFGRGAIKFCMRLNERTDVRPLE